MRPCPTRRTSSTRCCPRRAPSSPPQRKCCTDSEAKMPTPILMPKLSDDMREGKILAWKKKEGDAVESGEVIAEVETEKANLEVEAYNAGKLVKIVAPVGTTV